MSTATMNISLPESLKQYVHERARESDFSNPSDFVRSLIRDDQRRRAAEQLERDLFADFVRANPNASPAAWDELRTEFRARLAGLRAEIDQGLDALDQGRGRSFESDLANEIKERGRKSARSHRAAS